MSVYKEKKKLKNESITFRIDSDILKELRRESEQKEVSLNTSANQIFKQHVDWYATASKAGFISLPKTFIVKLMESISDEEAVKLAKYMVKNEIKDMILIQRKEYNLSSSLQQLEIWLKVSGITYRHEVDDTKHSYIMQHDMGRRWSIHLAEVIRGVFEDVSSKKAELEITDNILVLKFDTS